MDMDCLLVVCFCVGVKVGSSRSGGRRHKMSSDDG